MATLNFDLKQAPRELYEKSRWNVLTQFILHANGLNRCFPKLGTIAARIGSSVPTVVAAKKWLLEKGAITLVPYKKRVGEELACPKRQHVYQLTGVLKFGDQTVPYLYFGPKTFLAEISPSKTLPTEISSTKSLTQESLSISNRDSDLESNESDSSISIIGEPLPRSPDTAHPENKSEPEKQEPLNTVEAIQHFAGLYGGIDSQWINAEAEQEPLIPTGEAEQSPLDSSGLEEKDNLPPAPALPPVPEGYEAVWKWRVDVGSKPHYYRHYRLVGKETCVCGVKEGEMRGEGFSRPVHDEQCPKCAAKLAERQAKAAARAEKTKKPSAYSSTALFDAFAEMYEQTDDADKEIAGGRIGKVRAALVKWTLAKAKLPDLTEDQIKRLVQRIKDFPAWYAKACKGCSLPRAEETFMEWWIKYAKTFNGSAEGGPTNRRPWFDGRKALWFEMRDGVTYAKRSSELEWKVYDDGHDSTKAH